MTTTSADKTLASAFLYDFRCEESEKCIRYVSPDGSFEVAVEQKAGCDLAVGIEVYDGAAPIGEFFKRAKNFVSLLQ